METLRIKCPSCGIVLEVRNSKNEKVKKITCPNCQKQLAITFGDMAVPIGSLYEGSTRYQLNEGANAIPGIPSGIVELRVVRLKDGTPKHILRALTGEQKVEVNGQNLMQDDEVVLQRGDELTIDGIAFCFEKPLEIHGVSSHDSEQQHQPEPITPEPISPEPKEELKTSKSSWLLWLTGGMVVILLFLFLWPTKFVHRSVEETKKSERSIMTKSQKVVKKSGKTMTPQTQKQPNALTKIDLGYAVWDGKSVNGKPDGYGTMTFRSANRIDSRDDQGRIAQRGDKVRGNYIDGHLEYGTWMKSDGSKEEIFIGQ